MDIYTASLQDLLILKRQPRGLKILENRLNRQLKTVTDKLTRQLINSPYKNTHIYDDTITAVSMRHTGNVVNYAEREILRHPGIKLTESPINPIKIDKIISESGTKLSDYTLNRLHGDIIPTLKEGILEGQSLNKTANELAKEFVGLKDHEIMRITRTETHTAYNQSKQETMNSTDLIPGKQWLSSGLSNSRPEHEDANGQTVATDEPFIVMDEELMFPGDESGSPENIINCACTMIPDIRYGR